MYVSVGTVNSSIDLWRILLKHFTSFMLATTDALILADNYTCLNRFFIEINYHITNANPLRRS